MIKDIMVRLEGTAVDEPRLAAATRIAEMFDGHVTGLFLNLMPTVLPEDGSASSAALWAQLIEKAHKAGDTIEANLLKRLSRPAMLRRFDVFEDTIGDIAARQARAADTFIAHTLARNDGASDEQAVVEGVLFGSGRHLFLIASRHAAQPAFEHVLVAWNGSRESSRALGEALPYLHKARHATVVVVHEEQPVEAEAVLGSEAVEHLGHHGIKAELHHVTSNDVPDALIGEAKRREADLIVMGGYGHSRMREWLLGGATYELLRRAPVPLVIAH
jgi:nucleotide-binding universal stress UspA family protein